MKYLLTNHFRAVSEHFWHVDYLEYLMEVLKFKPQAAAIMAHIGLQQRRAEAYAGK